MLFSFFCHSKLNVFGFWIVDQTKQACTHMHKQNNHKSWKVKLTHHFGGYRRGRIKLLVPSTSLADDPAATETCQSDSEHISSNHLNFDLQPIKVYPSHISGLLVVVDVVNIPGQTEVSDLHHIIFCDQHVPGCQVSVNTLHNNREEANVSVQLYVLSVSETLKRPKQHVSLSH